LRYSFDEYELDTDRRELHCNGDLVSLEPQVFDLLKFLIQNRDRVVSRDDLIVAIWGGRIVSESALTSRINAVRSAVGDSGNDQRRIRTLPRKGIRFIAAVQEEPAKLGAAVAAEPISLPEMPSIAVLPFTNMSGDSEQDYFADGMAEEIITAMSRCKWLFVIARNSSFTYKGKSVDVRQIGRELGVRYIMEGSVRRAGDRLRIVGQLVDATSGAHIWGDRFEGGMSDVFELQDRITEAWSRPSNPGCSWQRSSVSNASRPPISLPTIFFFRRSSSNLSSPLRAWPQPFAASTGRSRSTPRTRVRLG
jgi:TolB-like protein